MNKLLSVESQNQTSFSRRKFFSLVGQAVLANAAIYTLGLAHKKLDGSLVAGAKRWTDTGGSVFCGSAPSQTSGASCTTAGAVGRGGMLGQNRCRRLVCQ